MHTGIGNLPRLYELKAVRAIKTYKKCALIEWQRLNVMSKRPSIHRNNTAESCACRCVLSSQWNTTPRSGKEDTSVTLARSSRITPNQSPTMESYTSANYTAFHGKGRLKMREWKMRHGQKCKGGKCRSSLAVDGQVNLECKERQR